MNQINKIHYCVTITTKSEKSSPSIGLYGGQFRYVTDNKDMSTVTFDEELIETGLTWNTDLLDTNGISGLSSQIDIVAGGDYSFLSNSTIQLVNKTNLGNTIHKSIEDLSDLSVLGADMQIFVIIDDIAYSRWCGMVTAKSFDEKTFRFLGSDKLTNSTNILENTIIGMINAEVKYNPLGEVLMDNVTSYRFNEINQDADFINMYRTTGDDGASFTDLDKFNGLGNGTLGMCQRSSEEYSIDIFVKDANHGVRNNDFIKFNSNNTIRRIMHSWTEEREGLFILHMKVTALDENMDYSFLFGDPFDEFVGPVHDSLMTLGSTDEGELSYFSIYSQVADTGLNLEHVPNRSFTVLHNGSHFNFYYTHNDKGGQTITLEKSVWKAKPVKVKYFASNKEEFASNNMEDRADFEDLLAHSESLHLDNTMLPKDYTRIGDEADTGSRYHYFNLTFKKSDLEGKEGLRIGTTLKGIFDGDYQQWQLKRFASSGKAEQWYYDDDSSDRKFWNGVNTTSMWAFMATQRRFFSLTVYNVIKDNRYGRVPISFEREYLPNVIDSWGHSEWTGPNYQYIRSFISSSLAVTNMSMPLAGVISIADRELWLENRKGLGAPRPWDENFYLMNQTDSYFDDMELKFYDEDGVDYIDILVSVSMTNEVNQDIGYQHSTDQWLSDLHDASSVPRSVFDLNGFCVYDECNIQTADIDLTIVNDVNAATSSYIHLLNTLSDGGETSNVLDRDDWVAGLHIAEATQRYGVITNLCKQGFVTGHTDRMGTDSYKTFLSSNESPIAIDNSNTIRGSIKSFKSTPAAKVYNEFTLTGDGIDTVSISNVDKDSFPLEGDSDWENYVSGVKVYETAKQYWNKAHDAFLVTNVIHKLPADRAKLVYAQSTLVQEYLTDEEYESLIVFSPDVIIEPGVRIAVVDEVLTPMMVKGITYYFEGATAGEYISAECVAVYEYTDDSGIDRVAVFFTVLESNVNPTTTTFIFEASKSYADSSATLIRTSTYRDKYLDLLLDWTTYPKLQVDFQLPITTDTVKYEVMREVDFHDPIITPDLGERGKGWLTKLDLDTKRGVFNVTITFEPEFFIIPRFLTSSNVDIVEDKDNTDYIVEDKDNTKYIIEK